MKNEVLQNPRVIVIQKLYGYYLNKDSEISFPKHRYKKFIKDVVNGTIERNDFIEEIINNELKDNINSNKTELIIKLMIMAALYEFLYQHKTPIKVIIKEYLKVSDFFVEESQKKFLNAILDKAAKIRKIL
jgi:transcription antitermination protein NusB